MTLKPYPAYKDSGVPWLGEIPEHWEVRKLRSLLTMRHVRNRPDLPLLSVVRDKGVIQRAVGDKEENHNYIPDDLSNYKVVNSGQFVMNKMKAWQGSYGISRYTGIVSPAYYVFSLKGVGSEFFHIAMRSKAYIPFFTRASDGVRVGQWDLSQPRMREIPFFIPSPREQVKIARFLHLKTLQINKFIRNKRKLVALLKEQKQGIINQAVTRGINPDVQLKPSGVEWLGEIPEHWEVMSIRRCSHYVKTGSTPAGVGDAYFSPIGFDWFTPGDFNDHLYLEQSGRQLSDTGMKMSRIFPPDTVMMVGIGATIGKAAISRQVASCNQQINGIVLNARVIPDFLVLVIRVLRPYIVSCGKYTTIPIINQNETKSLWIPVPSQEEQRQIVHYINLQTQTIDLTITRAEREIELMGEYRTRLISDVVTGKVDVRDIPVEAVPEEELLQEMEAEDPEAMEEAETEEEEAV